MLIDSPVELPRGSILLNSVNKSMTLGLSFGFFLVQALILDVMKGYFLLKSADIFGNFFKLGPTGGNSPIISIRTIPKENTESIRKM